MKIQERTKWKGKVKQNAKKQRLEKKHNQTQFFNKTYNSIKTKWKPKTRDKINMQKFFYFPKLTNYIGCAKYYDFPTKAEFAIWPVLCSRANFRETKWFKLTQVEIAGMAGLGISTVEKALKKLETRLYCFNLNGDVNVLEKKQIQKGKIKYYEYKVRFPQYKDKEIKAKEEKEGIPEDEYIFDAEREYFIFHTSIIESGIWAKLSSRAKMLYLALRSKSYYDDEFYQEAYSNNDNDFNTEYKFLLCEESLKELCKLAMISPIGIGKQVEELERVGLLIHFNHFIVGMRATLNKLKGNA